jgi:hypothetical protein
MLFAHRIHDHIETLAKLMPFCSIAHLDSICPMKAKKTITNDSSMVLAMKAMRRATEEGEKRPRTETTCSYVGCNNATTKTMAEHNVE